MSISHTFFFNFCADELLFLKEYDASHEGLIQSWSERFPGEDGEAVDAILAELHHRDAPYFHAHK